MQSVQPKSYNIEKLNNNNIYVAAQTGDFTIPFTALIYHKNSVVQQYIINKNYIVHINKKKTKCEISLQ